jgi:DNA-binding response OmpR family regulator
MNFAAHQWRGLRVLIVEDEYFLAQDLADRFQNLGAEVLGPAGTVAEALTLASRAGIDGAVLDVNLRGERVYPVADLLRQKQVPFVFASGYGGELEPDAYSNIPRCIKPVDFAVLVQALANQLQRKGRL